MSGKREDWTRPPSEVAAFVRQRPLGNRFGFDRKDKNDAS